MSNSNANQTQQVLLGAEFLAGREYAGGAGLAVNLFEKLGRIQKRQFEWFVEDHQQSMRDFQKTLNPFTVWMDHVARRTQHVGAGIEQAVAIAQEMANRGGVLHGDLWNQLPVASVTKAVKKTDMAVLDRLHADHGRLAQILKVMETLGNRLGSLTAQQVDVLGSCVDYIAEYPDAVHHPMEDRVFAHLLAMDLDEASRQQVEDNARRHLELALATESLQRDLSADQEESSAFAADIRGFVELQREHLRFEESIVFPLAQRLFSSTTLEELKSEIADAVDPVFEERRSRFDALYWYISEAETA
ncbi:MAG: hemerythrin domain-containing protein [Proteobacteria bacterium]|nr:hemerythrin domain-containing protein [Pseudomonadota bacterium]